LLLLNPFFHVFLLGPSYGWLSYNFVQWRGKFHQCTVILWLSTWVRTSVRISILIFFNLQRRTLYYPHLNYVHMVFLSTLSCTHYMHSHVPTENPANYFSPCWNHSMARHKCNFPAVKHNNQRRFKTFIGIITILVGAAPWPQHLRPLKNSLIPTWGIKIVTDKMLLAYVYTRGRIVRRVYEEAVIGYAAPN